MDKIGKINFTTEISSEISNNLRLEFLNRKFKIVEDKIRVDIFAKPTSIFSYSTPNNCFPKKKEYMQHT